jgi:hypothetical protein
MRRAGAALPEREARERVSRLEAESIAELASTREEAEGFARRIVLLEGELAEACQARYMAKENCRGLSNVAPEAEATRGV